MIWPQMRTEARSDVHSQFLGWNYEDDGKKDPCAGLSLSEGWGWARGGGQEWHFLHQGNELSVHQRVRVGEHELHTQHRFPARGFVRPPNEFPSGPRGGWHFFGWAQHGPGSPRLRNFSQRPQRFCQEPLEQTRHWIPWFYGRLWAVNKTYSEARHTCFEMVFILTSEKIIQIDFCCLLINYSFVSSLQIHYA